MTAQELRACLYHGEFNDLLKNLNENKDWRDLFGPVSSSLRDQELILRFLALYFVKTYSKPIADFLNKYMGKNRHLELQSAEEISNLFRKTTKTINDALGKDAFKPRGILIAAVFDAIMIGIACRIERGDIKDIEAIREKYVSLLSNKRFAEATATHTSDEENVKTRLAITTKAFKDIA